MAKRDLAWAGGGVGGVRGGQGQTNTMAEWDQNKNQFSRQSIHFPRQTQQSTIRSDSFIFFILWSDSVRRFLQKNFPKDTTLPLTLALLIFHILGKKIAETI
jgi:hypothetical protein